MMELRGIPHDNILDQATRRKLFFDEETDEPLLVPNTRGKIRIPSTKTLAGVIKC
jgi:hypothetical protein